MEIKKVKLIHIPANRNPKDKDGLAQPVFDDIYNFEVNNGKEILSIPNDPTNRHYQEVKAWYEKQVEKPFDFNFEQSGVSYLENGQEDE